MGDQPEYHWNKLTPTATQAIYSALDFDITQCFSHPEISLFFDRISITEPEFDIRYKKYFLDFFHFFLTEEYKTDNISICMPIENPLIPFLSRLHIRDVQVEEFLSQIHVFKNIFLKNAFFNEAADEVFLKMNEDERWEINTRFDNAVENLIKLFSQGSKNFLEGYKKAFDLGSINSITNASGIILYANDAFCKLSEYTNEELVGKSHNVVRHPDTPKEVFKDMWDTILAKKPWHWIIKNRKKWGGHYWVKALVMPILNIRGEISEFISMRIDITELKQIQEELSQTLEQLRQLDKQKTEFFNIANHELRTPMTAVYGFISMILDGDAGEINDKVREYLNQVNVSSKQLLRMINEMLDIAKMESWELKLFLEHSDLKILIEEAVWGLRSIVHGKNQSLEMKIDFDSCFSNIDRVKFKQLLVNIVGNAIKYTPDGGSIFVTVGADDECCVIKVRDTGVGIPAKHIGTIFEKFSQVKNSSTRDITGTGLWLAITKQIIEAFHGTITVESIEWKGSTFTIRIPTTLKYVSE